MSTAERIAAVRALHNESAVNNSHVYSVWEDGEITLEKAGDLYGQRNLHIMAYGDADKALPNTCLPVSNGMHSRIWCDSREIAEQAQAIIFE